MATTKCETQLTYKLVKVKGPLATGDVYRAVTDHKCLSARETLDEIAQDTKLDPLQLKYFGSSIFESMARRVLSDGRSRRFGDWFEMRLDIGGKFSRIDEAFDPDKHKIVVSFVPKQALERYVRSTLPVNERTRPRGRIDYVTYPGGDKGEIKFGEDIIIYGHDLAMQELDSIELSYYDSDKKHCQCAATLRDKPPRILEHDETHVRVRWFESIRAQDIIGKKATVYFNPWTQEFDAGVDSRGSSSQVVVLA